MTRRLGELEKARDIGWACGLIIHAGHGLTYRNIGPVAALEGLEDFNIGHSIICDALFVGLARAVQAMRAAIRTGAPAHKQQSPAGR